MKILIKTTAVSFLIIFGLFLGPVTAVKASWWDLQSIDTVKYSRDLAKEKENDSSFDVVIDKQVKAISETGATHVAIGTPYDSEFIPFMKRWVSAARKYGLNVWFRGNFSGWEEWFGYRRIDREEHLRLLQSFINENGDLFEDGDIFSPCSECENGGPGDPRLTGDVYGFRQFILDEYQAARSEFRKQGRNIESNYFAMNGDVARVVMNPETTKAMGGIVVIDHYVGSPTKLASDIKSLALLSGGKIVLGEFGAPIPDIHGDMNSAQQAEWVDNALKELSTLEPLVGINYWTNVGGSTEIWDKDLNAKDAVAVLKKYFIPKVFAGVITDEAGGKVKGAAVKTGSKKVFSGSKGNFLLPYFDVDKKITISAEGYKDFGLIAEETENKVIVLTKEKESLFFKIKKFFYELFH